MYIIWIMHVVQFFANTDMVVNEKKDTPRVTGENTEPLMEFNNERNWEYRPIKRRFYHERWCVWVLQAVAYTVVLGLYFTTNGHEIAFAVYIPVDFVLFIGMAAFYFT